MHSDNINTSITFNYCKITYKFTFQTLPKMFCFHKFMNFLFTLKHFDDISSNLKFRSYLLKTAQRV